MMLTPKESAATKQSLMANIQALTALCMLKGSLEAVAVAVATMVAMMPIYARTSHFMSFGTLVLMRALEPPIKPRALAKTPTEPNETEKRVGEKAKPSL